MPRYLLFLCLLMLPGFAHSQEGSLSKAQIRSTVQQHTASISKCYQDALITQPTLAGKITLSFAVNLDGTVSDVKIASSELGDPVDSCLVSQVATWTFPAPANKVQIQYPFVFKAEAPPAHFTKADLKKAMQDHRDALLACNTQGAQGTLTVSFTVQAEGAVAHVGSTASFGSPELRTCVENHISTWRFAPTPNGKDTRVSYPIVFK